MLNEMQNIKDNLDEAINDRDELKYQISELLREKEKLLDQISVLTPGFETTESELDKVTAALLVTCYVCIMGYSMFVYDKSATQYLLASSNILLMLSILYMCNVCGSVYCFL